MCRFLLRQALYFQMDVLTALVYAERHRVFIWIVFDYDSTCIKFVGPSVNTRISSNGTAKLPYHQMWTRHRFTLYIWVCTIYTPTILQKLVLYPKLVLFFKFNNLMNFEQENISLVPNVYTKQVATFPVALTEKTRFQILERNSFASLWLDEQ